MTLTSILSETNIKELKRAFNSQKEYLYFKISVFNVGTSIQVICTNRFRHPNCNGYDFIIENDFTTNYYIECELKNRTDKKMFKGMML